MTTTTTPLGTVQGIDHAGILAFRGIRYAEAPSGDLRFKPPVPVGAWTGTYDATDFGPAAPQLQEMFEGSPLAGTLEPEPIDEDCLFLNIYTPACDDRRRPVYFWIHGGAWSGGSGKNYDGATFASEHDIVVVTINYRLGLLGWAPVDHLTDDPAYRTAQNNGLLDQICALEWVRDNIAAFGGDPGDVTLGGESAGGGSICALLAAPAADALYHKAISQSPAADFGPPDARREALTDATIQRLGGTPDASGFDLLRIASVDDILRKSQADPAAKGGELELATVAGPTGFSPTVDGIVITATPTEAVAAKGGRNVPLMIGTNRHEGTMFGMMFAASGVSDEQMRTAFANAGADPDKAFETYRAFRPGGTVAEMYSDGLTETLFRNGVLRVADAQAGTGVPTWVYLFTFESPFMGGIFGSAHALELFFQWGWAAVGDGGMAGPGAPMVIGEHLRALWASFIRNGKPDAPGLPSWPTYDTASRPTMVINETVSVESDPDGATRRVWMD